MPGVTLSEIKRFGKSRAKNAKERIVYEMAEFVSRIKLEVAVRDGMVVDVVNVIQKVAHTGNTSDGKIFVINMEEIVKIGTNERGRDAI